LATASYQAAFFQAVSSTGVAVGTLIVLGSAPIACGLLAHWCSAEALPGGWTAATACAIAGCALLVLPNAHDAIRPIGVMLAAVAGACYGVYTVSAKRLLSSGHDPLAVLATSLAIGAVLLAPVLIGDFRPILDLRGAVLVVWLGIPATALAYTLFARGLGHAPAATAGTLSLAEPLTAASLGVIALGERPGPIACVGAALLLTGLVVAALTARATATAPMRTAVHQDVPDQGSVVLGIAGEEELGIRGLGYLLTHQAGQEQQRAARPVVRGDVLGLTGSVTPDHDGAADRLAADMSCVVLEPAVVAVGAGEVELLVLVQRADRADDCSNRVWAERRAVQ